MGPLATRLPRAVAGSVENDAVVEAFALMLGGMTMAVSQRYSLTGEIDADELADGLTAEVMNGVRVR